MAVVIQLRRRYSSRNKSFVMNAMELVKKAKSWAPRVTRARVVEFERTHFFRRRFVAGLVMVTDTWYSNLAHVATVKV